jgi:hypothetical protein
MTGLLKVQVSASSEAAIRVAHALGRGGVERGGRHVEGVDQGALLARDLGQGAAVGTIS